MYHNLENQLTQGDADILEMKKLRNDLEAYCYLCKGNVDSYGTWEKNVEESVRPGFIKELTECIDWIYGDGEQAPL